MAMRIALLVVRWFPRGWPGVVTAGGHRDSPRPVGDFPGHFGRGSTPFSVEGVFEPDGLALGDDDVGVVEEPV